MIRTRCIHITIGCNAFRHTVVCGTLNTKKPKMKRTRLADGSAATTNRLLRAMNSFTCSSSDASVLPIDIILESETVLKSIVGVGLSACKENIGSGTLHLTSRRMVWLQTPDTTTAANAAQMKGYALDLPCIVMHAVCRDPEAFASPCLYCHVDIAAAEAALGGREGAAPGEGQDDDMEGATEEMCLTPSDPSVLQDLFDTLSSCMESIGPEVGDEEGMEEGEEGDDEGAYQWFTAMTGQQAGAAAAIATADGAPYTLLSSSNPGLPAGRWFTSENTAGMDEQAFMEALQAQGGLSAEGEANLARLEGMLGAQAPGQFDDAPSS